MPKAKKKKRPAKVARPIVVGDFEFGHETVRLILRPGTGGEFKTISPEGGLPQIVIGAGRKGEWQAVVCVLMHEITEYAMFRGDCRYSPDNRIGIKSHADYLFVMTHEQFHDCISKVAEFSVNCLPALAKAWKGVFK